MDSLIRIMLCINFGTVCHGCKYTQPPFLINHQRGFLNITHIQQIIIHFEIVQGCWLCDVYSFWKFSRYCRNKFKVVFLFVFQDFHTNSFEQLCINYANETMQFFFNQHIFRLEQKEYSKEGIDWSTIEFRDNQPVIDLLASKPAGILCILDDECSFPQVHTKAIKFMRFLKSACKSCRMLGRRHLVLQFFIYYNFVLIFFYFLLKIFILGYNFVLELVFVIF